MLWISSEQPAAEANKADGASWTVLLIPTPPALRKIMNVHECTCSCRKCLKIWKCIISCNRKNKHKRK